MRRPAVPRWVGWAAQAERAKPHTPYTHTNSLPGGHETVEYLVDLAPRFEFPWVVEPAHIVGVHGKIAADQRSDRHQKGPEIIRLLRIAEGRVGGNKTARAIVVLPIAKVCRAARLSRQHAGLRRDLPRARAAPSRAQHCREIGAASLPAGQAP
jgi:hypothetical protein